MVAELLASSNAKKKKLVQTAADDLRDCSTSRASKLQQEMSNMQNCTSSAQEEWTSYVGEMEKHYIEDTTAVETGQDKMDDGLKFCAIKARMVFERWRQAYESLLSQQINNIDSIVQNSSMESNQTTRARLSSVALSALEEADSASSSSLSYIECKHGAHTLIFRILVFWLSLLLTVSFCNQNMKIMLLQVVEVLGVSALWLSL